MPPAPPTWPPPLPPPWRRPPLPPWWEAGAPCSEPPPATGACTSRCMHSASRCGCTQHTAGEFKYFTSVNNYLLGEGVAIPVAPHLAGAKREVDLAIGRGPAENAHLVDIDGGRKGGGDPRLALEAFDKRRAPDAFSRQWFRHT